MTEQASYERAGRLYGEGARGLQDTFDSRRLADTLSNWTVHEELTDDDVTLIERQSTVWLATVDADGWPDVSYKGGDVGFIQVVNRTEVRIPSYDGNGMWRTLGNIEDDGRVALLFVDLQRPWRMRVHGRAEVSVDPDDLAAHPGAQAVVIVRIGRIFPNCGRYIHRGGEISKFAPRPGHQPPIPNWKRYDQLRTVLPDRDQQALAQLDPDSDGSDGSSGDRDR